VATYPWQLHFESRQSVSRTGWQETQHLLSTKCAAQCAWRKTGGTVPSRANVSSAASNISSADSALNICHQTPLIHSCRLATAASNELCIFDSNNKDHIIVDTDKRTTVQHRGVHIQGAWVSNPLSRKYLIFLYPKSNHHGYSSPGNWRLESKTTTLHTSCKFLAMPLVLHTSLRLVSSCGSKNLTPEPPQTCGLEKTRDW